MQTQNFENYWKEFIQSFEGALINESKRQTLTYPLIKLILSEASTSWNDDTTQRGRWLLKFETESPEKGKAIEEILTSDMTVTEVKISSNGNVIRVAGPFGVGVAGYAVASMLGASTIGSIAAAVIPGVISIPIFNSRAETVKHDAVLRLIDAYVSQLNKYHDSVVSILLASV